MNSISKVLIACTAVCVLLYLAIAQFLGGTAELRDTLDVKSLSHVREAETLVRPEKVELAVETGDALVRDDSQRIDASTVLARSGTSDSEAEADNPGLFGESTAADAVEQFEGTAAEATASMIRETLGITKPKPPVRAVDVAYELPPNCDASAVTLAPVAVQYRYERPTIKASSLSELEMLMIEYRQCEGGVFHFDHNPLGKEDATPLLMQMRLDELKYFFLQHRVPKTALRFPDDS